MTRWRPVPRVVVLAVLLTACTSAGGTGPPPGGTTGSPTSTPPAVVVARRDFQITYRLDGVTRDSTEVGLVSNPQLSLAPSVDNGAAVQAGQRLGKTIVAPDVEEALKASAASSRIDKGRLARLRELAGPVTAPVGGLFVRRPPRLAVRAPGIDVVVDLTPIQRLRYQSLTFTGRTTVETVVGQRDVGCDAVWIQRPDTATAPNSPGTDNTTGGEPTGGTPTEGAGTGEAGTGSRLHCRLPRRVETAAGLRAQLTLQSDTLDDAVVIPNPLVGYDHATDGYFIRVRRDGRESTVPVVVGVTDGVVRVITSDVPVGATLLPPADGG